MRIDKRMVRSLVRGAATCIPGVSFLHKRITRAPGTESPRYCYSVWMRHLRMARRFGLCNSVPSAIAELGPGESIGIGLAALLSGAESYCGLDVIPLTRIERNLSVFEGLVEIFRQRADIPGPDEFPEIKPALDTYEARDLSGSVDLSEKRLDRIRYAVTHPNAADSMIRYVAPWWSSQVVSSGSVDMIYSQAVLEHVDDIDRAYSAMKAWLRVGGFMSHQIDLRCHGTADTWDGHRRYSDPVWKLMRGTRAYFINREPASVHLHETAAAGFEVVHQIPVLSSPTIERRDLASRFRGLANADLATSGMYVLARAKPD